MFKEELSFAEPPGRTVAARLVVVVGFCWDGVELSTAGEELSWEDDV